MKQLTIFILSISLLCANAQEHDLLKLTDGSSLLGEFKRYDDKAVYFTYIDGKADVVPLQKVRQVIRRGHPEDWKVDFPPRNSGPLTYKQVVVLDSITAKPSKDELFNHALAWVNDVYRNPESVIEIKDREAGQISIRAIIDFTKGGMFGYDRNFSGIIRYAVNILVKDGRYKYELSSFTHEARSINGWPPWSIGIIYNGSYTGTGKPPGQYSSYHQQCRELCEQTATKLIASLQEAMVKKSNDNW